jgi:tetratricopeptide (TPR) repeat protein
VKASRRNVILAIALLAFGAARMPYEAAVARDLRAANLIPAKLEIGTRDKIGQTSSAVALGGLRTLVATFMNLRAFSFFEEKKWDEVADTYNMIVDLAPRTGYYWDAGFSHSAYNAASYYINDSDMPPLRRKQAWRASITRGRNFLEKGIRNNPDNWNLWANLGFLLSDSNKYKAFGDPDKTFAEAAEAYRHAGETGKALDYVQRSEFYALARVVGREKDALALGRKLYANPRNRTPTLQTLLFVLECFDDPEMDKVKRAIEIYGSPENAYESLSAHWQRTRERFPVYGIAESLQAFEKLLKISADQSILNQPLPPPIGPETWFSK